MAKLKLFDLISKSNAVASWIERSIRIGRAVGINNALAGVGVAAATTIYGLAARFFGHVPWWIAVPLGLIVAVYALKFLVALKAAWAIRGVRTINIQDVAKECSAFHRDVMDFLVARAENAPRRFLPGDLDPHEQWARNADYSQQTNARLVQKFAHRAVALCQLVYSLGISPPSLWALSHNLADISVYLGTVGDLLERGLLREARSLNPKEKTHIMTGML